MFNITSIFVPLIAGVYALERASFRVIGMKGSLANVAGHVIFFKGDMNTAVECGLIFEMVVNVDISLEITVSIPNIRPRQALWYPIGISPSKKTT